MLGARRTRVPSLVPLAVLPGRKAQMSDYRSGQVGEGDGSHDAGSDLAFGMAIVKGSVVGLPLMIVFITVAVWLVTGQSWQTSIATALLPGVLFGVFGGGVLGMRRAMDHEPRSFMDGGWSG